jgi:hypothetical protein
VLVLGQVVEGAIYGFPAIMQVEFRRKAIWSVNSTYMLRIELQIAVESKVLCEEHKDNCACQVGVEHKGYLIA